MIYVMLLFLKMKRGIFVAGLREEIVASVEQILELMECGECKSSIFDNLPNICSSDII